jgi:hypothetical protein
VSGIGPAGSRRCPIPFLRVELENITRNGTQGATLSPSQVGDTKYLLAQPLPFWGKRDLKRDIADAAEADLKQAGGARPIPGPRSPAASRASTRNTG